MIAPGAVARRRQTAGIGALIATLGLTGCGGDSGTDQFADLVDDSNPVGGGSQSQWSLVWAEEFDGVELNAADWTVETGTGINGWGNNELQYYRGSNASVAGGLLTIEARRESFAGAAYTSARIKSEGKRFLRFGKVEIRARLPEGQGIWPALWMLGESFSSIGWPFSGEIDIMEMIGGAGREDTVFGTIHWDDAGVYRFSGGASSLASGTFSDGFHVFSIEWDRSSIRWFVDGRRYHTESIIDPDKSELRQPFFLIMNIAVGGNLPGSPDATTVFPQRMLVDYVRVYEAS